MTDPLSSLATLQTFSVEYVVTGSLDGTTPAPPFSIAPESPLYLRPTENLYRLPPVENLGIIDPDFGAGGTFGDRFIYSLDVSGPNPGTNFRISLLDVTTASPRLLKILANLGASSTFFTNQCIFVPQGGGIGLVGLTGSPSSPIVVRYNVVAAESEEEFAQILAACCCNGFQPQPPGPPCAAPPNPDDLPQTLDVALGSAIEVTLTGSDLGAVTRADAVNCETGQVIAGLSLTVLNVEDSEVDVGIDTRFPGNPPVFGVGTEFCIRLCDATEECCGLAGTFQIVCDPPDITDFPSEVITNQGTQTFNIQASPVGPNPSVGVSGEGGIDLSARVSNVQLIDGGVSFDFDTDGVPTGAAQLFLCAGVQSQGCCGEQAFTFVASMSP
jgi:hypothetical protein